MPIDRPSTPLAVPTEPVTAAPIVTAAVPTPKPTVAASSGSCPAGMASLPAGSFTMGDGGQFSSSGSAKVDAFCLDQTEVTADAYAACVKAGNCMADHLSEQFTDGTAFSKASTCNYGVSGRGNHPINCVDWGQAATYCHAMSKRLPTEEEWEWAARGGTRATKFPWGNSELDFQACWSGVSKRSGTCPVASLHDGDAPGGISDLAGNVWEWTSGKDSANGSRVTRGGGWNLDSSTDLRAAFRFTHTPAFRYNFIGFRCAR